MGLTCSTVTGTRAPWLSHIAVIPRLRAIRPVRIELGVHLAGVAEELGFAARAIVMRVILNCLHCEGSCGDLRASAQVASIVECNFWTLDRLYRKKMLSEFGASFPTFKLTIT
jgi:hypothetical protein